MKKLSLSLSVIVSFVLFSLFGKKSQNSPLPINPVPNNSPRPTSASSAVPVSNAAGFKDGSYTGSAADAFYGTIQVQAVITGGKITDVQFLQYPNDRRTSIEVNTQAMPYLKAEAIQAQSAQVDVVSGATDSSLAFIQSLGSALNQAK
jgi:uncharacterized protein with FMN-binding domain